MTAGETHQAIEATFRIERARLIGGLARMVRNVDLAEELAQDALVTALAEWPKTGVPANPGAWLMAVAKRRAVDAFRRDPMRARKHEEIARTLVEALDGAAKAIEAAMDDDLGDELLGLIFTACHPMLSPDARAALTLKVVGGLTTDEIARAFLSSEAAIAQRIVRAKKAIAKAGLTFEAPRGAERAARLPSVLEVTPERLWAAITDPDTRAKYHFGARIESDWSPGSTYELVHPGNDGSLADGDNLVIDPPKRLVQTMRTLWSDEAAAEATSRVTWEIEPVGDSCRLIVTHDQLRDDSPPEVYGGWPMILSGLKTWLETGDTLTTPGSLAYGDR